MALTTTIIFNPSAGSASEWEDWVRDREQRSDTRVQRTAAEGDAAEFARRASEDRHNRLVTVGGDGTINEAVNGLMERSYRPELAPLPGGTGNDFASTLGSPTDPEAATRWLDEESASFPIDVFVVDWGGGQQWGVNALHGGYAGQVSQDVDSDLKEQLGPLAYLSALPEAHRNQTEYETHITWGDGNKEVVDAVDVVVANGGTIGGGFPVDLTAELDDGSLEALVIRAGSLLNLAGVAANLASGHLLESDYVVHRSIQSAEFETRPPMSFNVDGETIGPTDSSGDPPTEAPPVSIDVHPTALPVMRPPEDD